MEFRNAFALRSRSPGVLHALAKPCLPGFQIHMADPLHVLIEFCPECLVIRLKSFDCRIDGFLCLLLPPVLGQKRRRHYIHHAVQNGLLLLYGFQPPLLLHEILSLC